HRPNYELLDTRTQAAPWSSLTSSHFPHVKTLLKRAQPARVARALPLDSAPVNTPATPNERLIPRLWQDGSVTTSSPGKTNILLPNLITKRDHGPALAHRLGHNRPAPQRHGHNRLLAGRAHLQQLQPLHPGRFHRRRVGPRAPLRPRLLHGARPRQKGFAPAPRLNYLPAVSRVRTRWPYWRGRRSPATASVSSRVDAAAHACPAHGLGRGGGGRRTALCGKQRH
ncbi:uncharacterized protein CC84DRAFT_1259312, partial [Paraphaeosphaeria sporulosa]